MSYSVYHSVTGSYLLSLFTVSEWILEGAVELTSDTMSDVMPIVYATTVVLSFSKGSLHGFPLKEKWGFDLAFGFFLSLILINIQAKYMQNFHQKLKHWQFGKVLFC